ncbi:GNAT family N-acetyltransferase [Roseibium algae]|uniref:GNAT family N-acetyltransferase n=1 Tax=Roseibium algae TaxID=3123038 RepID=A0ABU8TKN7_9HYPH
MQDIVIDTMGVRLSPFSVGDLPLLADLHADPSVHRYLSSTLGAWSTDKVSSFLDGILTDQELHGFSAFKVTNSAKMFLGWAGFSPLAETSEIAMRSCFSKDALADDPKLAIRVSQELIEWFFENTYFSHIVMALRTDDRDGRMTAQDLGFVYRESRRIDDMPCDVFQLLSPSMRSYVLSA